MRRVVHHAEVGHSIEAHQAISVLISEKDHEPAGGTEENLGSILQHELTTLTDRSGECLTGGIAARAADILPQHRPPDDDDRRGCDP